MHRETQEELFFHADPHPANLIILPDNKICFIDFGAIGRFSTQTRKLFRELAYHTAKGDIGRITNTSLSLLGPLPPMDVERVRFEMEKIYSDAVYALQSEDAEWWEKSSAQGWLRFLEVARKFSLPASFEALLFFRTTFSYDIIVHRLNRKIDVVKEWQRYQRDRGREARKRVKENFKSRLRGPTDMDYLAMEEFGDMLTVSFFQLQRNIETPIIHFRNIVGKIAYIVSLFLKLGYLVGVAVGHRPHRELGFNEMARSRDRLGPDAGVCDHLRLGPVGPDCSRPCHHPQDHDPLEPSGYPARFRSLIPRGRSVVEQTSVT